MNIKRKSVLSPARALAAVVGLGALTAATCPAQGIIASGQITGTAAGGGTYDYSLTVSDSSTATSGIGSFWYAWVPGQFYLPTMPLSAHAPTGWSANIFDNSIQFVASSSAYDIAANHSLSGFGFSSTDTPAAIGGNSPSYPTIPVGTTVAYGAGLFSSPSETFVVTSVVPEPSSVALALAGFLGFMAVRQAKGRVG